MKVFIKSIYLDVGEPKVFLPYSTSANFEVIPISALSQKVIKKKRCQLPKGPNQE